jgi:hypothetical protein
VSVSPYSFTFDGPYDAKFEYCTMEFRIPEPINYDEYKIIQPWPFNKPDLILDVWLKPIKPLEYLELSFIVNKNDDTNNL